MTVNAYTEDLLLDDVRFSNAVTVEHNTLGPGVIGHVLRHTTTDPATYARAHRWFHFDQVGSVLAATDASGAVALRHDQDAFGNTLSSWQTGLVGGHRPGWHHNTKEFDGDLGWTYAGMRWIDPATGTFTSQSPLAPLFEHSYLYALANPVLYFDASGLLESMGGLRPTPTPTPMPGGGGLCPSDWGPNPPGPKPFPTPDPDAPPPLLPYPPEVWPPPTATPFPTMTPSHAEKAKKHANRATSYGAGSFLTTVATGAAMGVAIVVGAPVAAVVTVGAAGTAVAIGLAGAGLCYDAASRYEDELSRRHD
jgi:RHS repeat-associated protein